MSGKVLVCMHHWGDWNYCFYPIEPEDLKDPKTKQRWRACSRCTMVQRNDDPEPRAILARIEDE